MSIILDFSDDSKTSQTIRLRFIIVGNKIKRNLL